MWFNSPLYYYFIFLSVYGCPWDGREFADVRRSGLTKHMNITCNNGTKLFNVCEDESLPKNDLPICNEDGTWRCDPRCIPDDDESKSLKIIQPSQ